MWSRTIIDRFKAIPANPRENDFYAPYNKLLNTVFPVDSDFTVAPQSYPLPTSRDSIDFVIEYVVLLQNMPVYILEIKEPSKIHFLSSRQEADKQIRTRLRDLREQCKLDIFYGTSAYGTQFCVYQSDKHNLISPLRIVEDPELLVDTAPKERWAYDVLQKSGYEKLMQVFNYIKEETKQLTFL